LRLVTGAIYAAKGAFPIAKIETPCLRVRAISLAVVIAVAGAAQLDVWVHADGDALVIGAQVLLTSPTLGALVRTGLGTSLAFCRLDTITIRTLGVFATGLADPPERRSGIYRKLDLREFDLRKIRNVTRARVGMVWCAATSRRA
jgi:hypothetical protein